HRFESAHFSLPSTGPRPWSDPSGCSKASDWAQCRRSGRDSGYELPPRRHEPAPAKRRSHIAWRGGQLAAEGEATEVLQREGHCDVRSLQATELLLHRLHLLAQLLQRQCAELYKEPREGEAQGYPRPDPLGRDSSGERRSEEAHPDVLPKVWLYIQSAVLQG